MLIEKYICKEINRIYKWLSDRVKLKEKWKLFAWSVFQQQDMLFEHWRSILVYFPGSDVLLPGLRSQGRGPQLEEPWLDLGAQTSRSPNSWFPLHHFFEICRNSWQGARLTFHFFISIGNFTPNNFFPSFCPNGSGKCNWALSTKHLTSFAKMFPEL